MVFSRHGESSTVLLKISSLTLFGLALVLPTLSLADSPGRQFQIMALELDGDDDADPACIAAASKLAADETRVFERKRQLGILERCVAEARQNRVLALTASGETARSSLEQTDALYAGWETLIADAKATNKAASQFQGMSWGVGFGISYAFDDIVSEAEVVDGVIRSTKDETLAARIVLETHRYMLCNKGREQATFGCGPFGMVATGLEDVLAGVGFGFMFGWKSPDPQKGTGFSLGLGALLDNNVSSLADGFEENAPLPPGETAIRFESKARWSAVLFFTRTF